MNNSDSINIFSILRIENAEIRHSNMLKWLLDPNENHGLGQAMLGHLLGWLDQEHDQSVVDADALSNCDGGSFSVVDSAL